jgi:hypothetical protein
MLYHLLEKVLFIEFLVQSHISQRCQITLL